MKLIVFLLLSVLCSLSSTAQMTFSISGTIENSRGEKVPSVTVFIDGTSRAAQTDADGKYELANLSPGNLTVVTSRLGYVSERKPLLFSSQTSAGPVNRAVTLNFTLQDKSIVLDEVKIGDGSGRAEMLRLFNNRFLGFTENGLSCKILNTQVLELSTIRTVLVANSSDFMIIENKNLGYRIKYLLKRFTFNSSSFITNYDGDCIFEELPGSKRNRQQWAKNRKKVYDSSFMRYLRCLYDGTLSQTKFKTLEFADDPGAVNGRTVKKEVVDMRKYVSRVDSTFVKFAVNGKFFVMYGDRVDLVMAKVNAGTLPDWEFFSKHKVTRSEFNLYLDHTFIDKGGRYLDYRSFLLDGYWGGRQIGDRLPFSYVPE
ncbi:MAG TPA: carboxypeptidase-like regulatory domain-containing protein [Pedobacter sp.]|uniref:carboxypeptidase-like regulatory domain-containing protein n=1 Tax=Pedobacter sp. TaxID=1411316 RepID=UPI002B97D3DE|nr:carboxypeptidase-like regulatory domain-containing protein [Pedobacter sp.]HMI03398.1 carboxypeptidase-like regulatory domain-containing protein [Pedobacter sp.]